MITAQVHLKSISPYSHSKKIVEPKQEGESDEDWEARCWKNRLHTNSEGNVIIPPGHIKGAIDNAGPFLGMKIKNEGKKTWTKVIQAGIMILDPVDLGIKAKDVEGEWLFMNANGKPGAGTRVPRCYPRISHWEAEFPIEILNPKITKDIFLVHLECAGKYIGIGRFRPANRGFYGRFSVVNLEWIKG